MDEKPLFDSPTPAELNRNRFGLIPSHTNQINTTVSFDCNDTCINTYSSLCFVKENERDDDKLHVSRQWSSNNSSDPLTKERGICLEYDCAVKKLYEVFAQCEKRVKSKEYTAETCEEEIIDLMEELDHCVDEKAFNTFV